MIQLITVIPTQQPRQEAGFPKGPGPTTPGIYVEYWENDTYHLEPQATMADAEARARVVMNTVFPGYGKRTT